MQPLRVERMKALIRQEIASLLQKELKDPRIGFVTLTRVEVSPDARHANLFFSVLGSEELIQQSMQGLERARGFIQHRIAQVVQGRHCPQIQIHYDPSLAHSEKVQTLLKKITEEEKPQGEP
jgi:ribosome-binding factor A